MKELITNKIFSGIGVWQAGCLFVLFIGIFFTLEPSIFGMRPYLYPSLTHPVDINAGSWYFYVTFAFAWLPLAIGFVLMEKVQKAYVGVSSLSDRPSTLPEYPTFPSPFEIKRFQTTQIIWLQKHKLAYIAWFQLFIFTSYILFIWVDFIPEFGLVSIGTIMDLYSSVLMWPRVSLLISFMMIRNAMVCVVSLTIPSKEIGILIPEEN